MVEIFHFVGLEKREELIAKIQSNNEKIALRQLEKEEIIKVQEAEKVREEETRKKGGKAPPAPKPKDPKKAAAELEERKLAILKSMGSPIVK